jgi:hypothetical protein
MPFERVIRAVVGQATKGPGKDTVSDRVRRCDAGWRERKGIYPAKRAAPGLKTSQLRFDFLSGEAEGFTRSPA